MYIVPEENLACVALTNRSDNGEFAQQLVDDMAATVIPNWTTPNVSVALPMMDFPGGPAYSGKWSGKLHGGGTEMSVSLEITPGGPGTVSLASKHPEPISNLKLQGTALIGRSVGSIDSENAIRNKATSLSLKLRPRDDKLAGRILASAAGLGELATLPYVVSLSRSK